MSAVAVATLALTACAAESESAEATSTTVTETTTTTVTTAESTTEAPETTSEVPTEETEYEKYERILDENNITIQYGNSVAEAYDYDVETCDEMRSGERTSYDLASTEKVRVAGDPYGERLKLMVPILCPDQQPVMDEAVSGYPVQQEIFDSSYVVADMREQGGPMTVQPGTWRTVDSTVSDCYWERGDANGNIIDNNFITFSPGVTVTIAPTDATFVSRGCGNWQRAQ